MPAYSIPPFSLALIAHAIWSSSNPHSQSPHPLDQPHVLTAPPAPPPHCVLACGLSEGVLTRGCLSSQVSSTPNNKTSDPCAPAAKARVSPHHLHPHTSNTGIPFHLLSTFTPCSAHSTSTQDTPNPCCSFLKVHENISRYDHKCTLQFTLLLVINITMNNCFLESRLKRTFPASQFSNDQIF